MDKRLINKLTDGTPVELVNLMNAVDEGIRDMWGDWAVPDWEVTHEYEQLTHTWRAYCHSNLTDINLRWRA